MSNFALILLLISGSVWSRARLVIDHPDESITRGFELAEKLFIEEVGEVSGDIVVVVNPEECLRTGYDRSRKAVVFCPGGNVREMGLKSPDVIHHEFFHALLCQYRPELCERDKSDALHEALADTFAHKLLPDADFGEGFYLDRTSIRSYKTYWRPGLVQGTHEKGNAMAALFIAGKKKIGELLSLFDRPESPEEVTDLVNGVTHSRLNRYRLFVGRPMKIEFQFAEEAKVKTVVWKLPAGIKATRINQKSFQIEITTDIDASKGFAHFLSEEGKEIGRRTYYFGVK